MSTVTEAKAALLALWSAVFDPADVQVTYGNRVTIALGQRITIGDVTGTSAPQSLGPARQMREDYEIRCLISVTVNGTVDDQQAVTESVLELFAGAEYAVRSLPGENLGIAAVTLAVVEGNWALTEAQASDTGGPINSSYEFRVRVQARYRLS